MAEHEKSYPSHGTPAAASNENASMPDFAAAAAAGAATGGLMIVEVDGLNRLTRAHGPAAADVATAHAERLLRLCLRRSDGLVSWGASEFLVLLSHADATSLSDLAELIVMAMRNQPAQMDSGHRLHLTCSIGWAVFAWRNGDGHTWLGPIGEAGAALQVARDLGGDCACAALTPGSPGLFTPAPPPHTARLLIA